MVLEQSGLGGGGLAGQSESTTAVASSALSIVKRGATLPAHSTNRATAAESTLAPTSSEGTGHNCPSATPNPSRMVVRIVTAATASGTAAGSATAASSKNQTPSGNSSGLQVDTRTFRYRRRRMSFSGGTKVTSNGEARDCGRSES